MKYVTITVDNKIIFLFCHKK